MRRYFFDMREGGSVIPDEEGMDLLTMDAVQEEAARALTDMARDEVRSVNGNGARHLAIEVRDGEGPVMIATFSFQIKRLQ